jgi:hypothetical protein
VRNGNPPSLHLLTHFCGCNLVVWLSIGTEVWLMYGRWTYELTAKITLIHVFVYMRKKESSDELCSTYAYL